jgi:hypothetical protein
MPQISTPLPAASPLRKRGFHSPLSKGVGGKDLWRTKINLVLEPKLSEDVLTKERVDDVSRDRADPQIFTDRTTPSENVPIQAKLPSDQPEPLEDFTPEGSPLNSLNLVGDFDSSSPQTWGTRRAIPRIQAKSDPLQQSSSEPSSSLEDFISLAESEPFESLQQAEEISPNTHTEAFSETIVSPWADPQPAQVGETLISPLANPEPTATVSKIADEQIEQLAQVIYQMLQSHYQINAERYHHLHSTHPPWLNINRLNPRKSKASELEEDWQLRKLAREVYRDTNSRLECLRERQGRFY